MKEADVPNKNFDVLFETYRQNVYPAMLEYLAKDLGVSTDSLTAIGVGYEFVGPPLSFLRELPNLAFNAVNSSSSSFLTEPPGSSL